MGDPVEPDARARCPACHALMVQNKFSKTTICWRCRLSDNRYFEDDKQYRQWFIAEFVEYVGDSEIDRNHGRALSKLLLGAIVQSDPRQVCKKAIVKALHAQEKKTKRDAIVRARYSKAHPGRHVPDDKEIAEEASLEVGETLNYTFNFLSIYDARCALAAMRGIFAFLNPDFSANVGLSGRLEQELASDRFLSLDEHAREDVIADFLIYIDAFEINQNHHFVLNDLFLDAVNSGNLQLVSKETIAKALGVRADEYERVDDSGEGYEDFIFDIDKRDPRCILAAMQAIYAFLTPDTSVKPLI